MSIVWLKKSGSFIRCMILSKLKFFAAEFRFSVSKNLRTSCFDPIAIRSSNDWTLVILLYDSTWIMF